MTAVTFSLAMMPSMEATAKVQAYWPACTFPNPNGTNSGERKLPSEERMLSWANSSSMKLQFQRKWLKNQTMIVESKMMVKALMMKCLALSQIWIIKARNCGR